MEAFHPETSGQPAHPPDAFESSSSRRSSIAPSSNSQVPSHNPTMPQPLYTYPTPGPHGSHSGPFGNPLPSPFAPPGGFGDTSPGAAAYGDHSFVSQPPPQSLVSPSATLPPHPSSVMPPPQGRPSISQRPMPSGQFDPTLKAEESPSITTPRQMSLSETSASEPYPTHVVGSQGRRGILPSAPGRASAVSATGNSAKNITPVKDADGKFPCPHCNKTYLHAKHLKRHLLRHTGDRPYTCFLCKDTFSRSDILKRHFQKCSLRRGNPTGASHLAHAQTNSKKPNPGSRRKSSVSSDFPESSGDRGNYDPGDFNSGVMGGIPSSGDGLHDMHDHRSDSTVGGTAHRNSYAGMSTGSHADLLSSHFGTMPDGASISEPQSATSAVFPGQFHLEQDGNFQSSQNLDDRSGDGGAGRPPLDMYGQLQQPQQSGLDWPNMVPPSSQNEFLHPLFHTSQEPAGEGIKATSNFSDHGQLLNSVYPTYNPPSGAAPIPGIDTDFVPWQLDVAQLDPKHKKTERLLELCFPSESQLAKDGAFISEGLRDCLNVDNVQHFINLFTNFQGHWPIIHVPTFNYIEAYDGLVLAMVCIGAVYSERITVEQVRELMERVQNVIERTSMLFGMVKRQDTEHFDANNVSPAEGHSHVEQLQALFLIQMLFTWHGTSEQRASVRKSFPRTVDMARLAGLFAPCQEDGPAYSIFHQPEISIEKQHISFWDWDAWVSQEKRVRVMYNIYLLDTALVMYFNVPPIIDAYEVRIPLPADDAAWDARDGVECADALGLHGAEVQRRINVTGSRRLRQPEMQYAFKALLQPHRELQPASTNIYAKFILVHALHVQIWRAQRLMGQPNGTASSEDLRSSQAYFDSPSTSEGVVPQSLSAPQLIQAATDALAKWKRVWDADWISQYPWKGSNLRRFGFCRDGVHFYWLARVFLARSGPMDCSQPADRRMSHVMRLLKNVQRWVIKDTDERGEDIGSVGDIDVSYGMEDLTLDMKLLFKPINEEVDSPVSGVHTDPSGSSYS